MKNRGIVPSLIERVIYQARPEIGHVGNRGIVPSSNERGVCSSTHAHVSRYTETGTRWDNRGRGKTLSE